MKKHISLLLVLMMIFTMLPMGMTVVSAEGIAVTQSAADAKAATVDVIDISTLQSEIVLTFAEALPDAQAEEIDEITIEGTQEKPFKGEVVPSINADKTQVTLVFGRLADGGTYTLTVPASVTGGEAVTFTYLATEPTEKRLDFTAAEGFTVGEALPTDKGILNPATNNLSVVADGDSDNAVRLQPGTGDANAGTNFNFIYDLSNGAWNGTDNGQDRDALDYHTLTNPRDVYVIDTALKPNTPQAVTAGCGYGALEMAANAGQSRTLTFSTASALLANGGNLKNGSANEISKDSAGWAKVRAVLRVDGKRYNYQYKDASLVGPGAGATSVAIDLYDASPNNTKYIDTTIGGSFRTVGIKIAGFSLYKNNANFKKNYVDVDYIYARKDKAMTVLKQETAYTKGGSLVFHMSDDIDASTLSAIKVTKGAKGETGTAVTGFATRADNANRTITVDFSNGIADAGTYTVDLSGVLGTNGVAVYNGLYQWNDTTKYSTHENLAKIEFTVAEEEAGALDLIASSTPAANAADVSVHVGQATVTYGVALDEDTLEGISIVSVGEGGAETVIKGKIIRDLSDDGKTVTLKFGRLGAGAHKIKVDGTVLKNADGENVASEEIAFTAVEDAKFEKRLDFTEEEGFKVGAELPTDKDIVNAATNADLSVVKEGEDENANQVLRLKPATVPTAVAEASLVYNLSGLSTWDGTSSNEGGGNADKYSVNGRILGDNTNRDVYIIDTAIRPSITEASGLTSATAFDLRATERRSGSNALTMPTDAGDNTGVVQANSTSMENSSADKLTKDANGWVKARAVLREDGQKRNYSISAPTTAITGGLDWVVLDLYDANPDNVRYIGKRGGGSFRLFGIDIARIKMPANASTATTNYIDVDYIYARKDKAMTILESELSYTSTNKQIKFYMTDDIDEASKDDVVVKYGNTVISDRTVTVNAAERSLTITFDGLAAGSYTVDLRDVIGTNGVGVYNDLYSWDTTENKYVIKNCAIVPFEVDAADGIFKVGAVTIGGEVVEEEDTIDPDAMEIEIAFPSALQDGAENNITFEKSSSARIAGKLLKSVSEDKKTVTLKFGRLEDGAEYILTIPETVKNEDGAAVEPMTYTLTAERTYEIIEDFSGLDANKVLNQGMHDWGSANKTASIAHFGGNASYYKEWNTDLSNDKIAVVLDGDATVKESEDNDKYLEIAVPTGTTSGRPSIWLAPNPASDKGFYSRYVGDGYVLATELSFNSQAIDPLASTSHRVNILGYGRPDGVNMARTTGTDKMGALKSYYSGNGIDLDPEYAFDAVEEGDYNTARVVTSKNAATTGATTASYKLYDMDNGGKYVGKQNNPSAVAWDIVLELAGHQVASTLAGTENVKINITEFKVFQAKAMSILDKAFDGEKLTIWMTDDIDHATAKNIVITTAEGESTKTLDPSIYKVVCDDTERTIEITFPYGLKTAGTYNVSFADVEPKNGLYDGKASTTFEVAEGSVNYIDGVNWTGAKTLGGEFLPLVEEGAVEGESVAITDAVAVKVDAEIGAQGGINPVVFLAVYDKENGKLINVVQATETDGVYSATVTGLTAEVNEEVKLFVWESVETLQPLFKPLQRL